MSSKPNAVIIADVKASSARANLRAVLGKKLSEISKLHLRRKWISLAYSVTAGDEFQTIASDLAKVPHILHDLHFALRPLSLRIGVGFGQITEKIQPPVNRLGGEAFQSARKAIENVKSGVLHKFDVLTAFQTQNPQFDEVINLIYGLNDSLILEISDTQWQNMEEFYKSPSLDKASKRLRRDISTVSRNLKRGYYWQLLETVKVAESLIARTFS